MGLHFLAFWPCGPSFPCILALWAFISLHFGLFGVGFWAPPPQVAKNGPFAQRPYNGFSSAVPGPILQFFSLLGLHFLAFWPCGPSFRCILALWAFISLHFGLVSFHFLAFWPCGPSFPCILALWAFASFHSCILALWAFISLHFGLVGLHFLAFWPCGPSFPCILAFSGSASGPPPQVAKNGPFAQRPYNGFIRAVTGSILQFLAFWAFISLHFGLVGLHFHAFWLCGPSFPCILALWAFISLHFGLVGRHFLAFWPCGPSLPFILAFSGSASGVHPTSCQKWPVCPTSLQWI